MSKSKSKDKCSKLSPLAECGENCFCDGGKHKGLGLGGVDFCLVEACQISEEPATGTGVLTPGSVAGETGSGVARVGAKTGSLGPEGSMGHWASHLGATDCWVLQRAGMYHDACSFAFCSGDLYAHSMGKGFWADMGHSSECV